MPLHPVFVHFPIALLVAAWVLYILFFFRVAEKPWGFPAYIALLAGTVMLIPALISGSIAEELVEKNSPAHEVVSNHEIAGYVLAWLAVMLTGWASWRQKSWKRSEAGMFLGLLSLLVAILFYAGSLGGELVYQHGTGVTPIP
jgi:uncharacterized membrane protein